MKGPYLSRAVAWLAFAGQPRDRNGTHSEGDEPTLDFDTGREAPAERGHGRRTGATASRGLGTGLTVMRQMRCRWCAQTIRSSATICPVCMRPLEPMDIDVFDWPPWRGEDARVLATDLAVPLSFDYGGGADRRRRRIVAEHVFEWTQAVYVRGHDAQRGYTRSYRLDNMENVVDERSGEKLKDVEGVRRVLLRSGKRQAAQQAAAQKDRPAAAPAARAERVIVTPPPDAANDVGADPRPRSSPIEAAERVAAAREDVPPPSRWERDPAPAEPFLPDPPRRHRDEGALAVPPGWVPAMPDHTYFFREDRPLMQAVRHKGVPFAQGFLVASSLAVGVIGFVMAEHSAAPKTAPQAAAHGYDSRARQEMETLVHSLREATAAAQAARAAAKEATAAATAAKPVMPEAVPAALHSAPLTPTEVRTLQDALNRLGYPAGTPDGIFGARTGAALAAWLSDHRMIQQRRPLRALLAMIRAELAKVSRPTTADARPIAAR
jgi:hypothetical protein